MSELSKEAREALEAVRSAEPRPSSEDKARIKAMIAAAAAAPIVLDPSTATATTGASIGAKVGAALLAVGIAGAVYVGTRDRPVTPPPPAIEQPAIEQPVIVEEPSPPPVIEQPIVAPKKRAAPKVEAPTPASRLAEEAALIRAAKAALRANDRATALEKVRAHAEQFPDGELKAERIAVEAIATCNAELLPEGSPYRAAVQKECE